MKNVAKVISILILLKGGSVFATPFTSDDRILILPFINFTSVKGIEKRVTKIFTHELIKSLPIKVYPPYVIKQYFSYYGYDLPKDLLFEDKGKKIALNIGANKVILGAITEYDGFYPYSLGLVIEVHDVARSKILLSKGGLYESKVSFFEKLYGGDPPTIDRFLHIACRSLIKEILGGEEENRVR